MLDRIKKPNSFSQIPSNPPKKTWSGLDKNYELTGNQVPTVFHYVLDWQGGDSKLPRNHALPLKHYLPQDPDIKPASLTHYLQEYSAENHFLPRYIPHQLMHWWENHFAGQIEDGSQLILKYEGFHDILLLINSLPLNKPDKKVESSKMLKFILKHIQKKVDLYLQNIILEQKIPEYRKYAFVDFCSFLFCFLVFLEQITLEISKQNQLEMSDFSVKFEQRNSQILRKIQFKFQKQQDLVNQKNKEHGLNNTNIENRIDIIIKGFLEHILPNDLYEDRKSVV